jgi:hypothetical protein
MKLLRALSLSTGLLATALVALLLLTTAAGADGPNLITNPSFETTPFPANWVTFQSSLSQVAVSNAPDGTYVAKDTSSNAANWFSMDWAGITGLTAGTVLDGSAYVEAANSVSVGQSITLEIRERNAAGTTVGDSMDKVTIASATKFQQLSTSYTIKATGDTIDEHLLEGCCTAKSSPAFYADLFSLAQQSTVTAPTNTALPVISGTAQQGDVLSATTGTWTGSPTGYAYQWQDCTTGCANITGATSSTYTLANSDVGDTVDVVVTATNAGGSTPATSAQTATIAGIAPSNVTVPVVSGTVQQGDTLTTTDGSWIGTTPITYTYQWQDCASGICSNIGGATSSSYVLGAGDVGDTVDVVVTATNIAGNANALSAQTATIAASSGGGNATVPASPSGPATPSGGWTVEYGDAFGSCLTFTDTGCSAGYPRSDNSLSPQTNAGGNGNPNEITAFEPANMDVSTAGLVTHCTQTANLGDAYSCGQVLGNGGPAGTNGHAPAAPHPFYFDPKTATTAIQYVAQLPANQGDMDPGVWENSVSDNPEIDNAEYFGMHQPPQAGACGTWTGDGWGFPAIPFGGSQVGNGDSTYWCQGAGPGFDPSATEHTYTMYFNAGACDGYVDGVLITSGTCSFTTASFKLLLGMSMRKDTKTGQSYALPAGGNTLTIRYIAVYEATSANNAGTNGPIVEPGSSVS